MKAPRIVSGLVVLAMTLGWGALPATIESTDARLSLTDGRLLRNGLPLTGVVVERAANRHIVASTAYREGLRDGESLRFDHDGTVLERRTWKAGKREGTHAAWYPRSGRPRFCATFHDDLSEGAAYEWADRSGCPIVGRWQYVHGVEVGMQRVWRADGVVRASYLALGNARYGLRGKKECSR